MNTLFPTLMTMCHFFNGADYFGQMVQKEVIMGDWPAAVKSKIGYWLSGPLQEAKKVLSVSYIFNVIAAPPNVTDLEKI